MRLFLCFLTSAWLVTATTSVAFANAHGVFQVVKGKVQVKSGKDGKTERAKIGQKVFPKDTIITGPDSRAKIVMVDTNVINVSPDSSIEIEAYEFKPEEQKKNVLLNVIYGKVRSKVNQKYDGDQAKFQVKTKSAVAGVRGTDFLASFNPQRDESQVVTFEGEVEFGKPGPNGTIENPVSVGVGQMAEQIASAPPAPPRSVPPQMLASLNSSTDTEAGGGSDEREPASDKGDKGKSGDAKEGNKTDNDTNKDNKGGGPGAKNDGGGSESRAPASTGMTPPASAPAAPSATSGMFMDSDFAGGGGDAVMVGDDKMLDPVFDPVIDSGRLPTGPEQVECEFCNRLIEEGTARILLQVRDGSAP